MNFLTKDEFISLGFDDVADFDKLLLRAKMAVDLYTGYFYDRVDFESDFKIRKALVKEAVAFQIAYLDSSGILTAEDKHSVASMSVGRTSISYQGAYRKASGGRSESDWYNLSIDALTRLKQAGFSYQGVSYDR